MKIPANPWAVVSAMFFLALPVAACSAGADAGSNPAHNASAGVESETSAFGEHTIATTRDANGTTVKLTMNASGEEVATIAWDPSMMKVHVKGAALGVAIEHRLASIPFDPAITLPRLNRGVEAVWTQVAASPSASASPPPGQAAGRAGAGGSTVTPQNFFCISSGSCTNCYSSFVYSCPVGMVGQCQDTEDDETCYPGPTSYVSSWQDCSQCYPAGGCDLGNCQFQCESIGETCALPVGCTCM